MQTVLIEIDDQKGLQLLHDLEDLNVLKIINENVSEIRLKLSDKYRGVFSKDDAASFMQHTETMRKEWGNT